MYESTAQALVLKKESFVYDFVFFELFERMSTDKFVKSVKYFIKYDEILSMSPIFKKMYEIECATN